MIQGRGVPAALLAALLCFQDASAALQRRPCRICSNLHDYARSRIIGCREGSHLDGQQPGGFEGFSR